MTTVAVIGSGVSGLTAAYLLRHNHEVTLYERDDRLGGHAHTHTLSDPTMSGRGSVRVDSGFIVHNERTYPLLRKLFGELGVDVIPTEMSMSISDRSAGVEYAGGRGIRGIFAQKRRLVDRRFVSMLMEVKRFHRLAVRHLAAGGQDGLPEDDGADVTYGQFLRRHGFSDHFIGVFAIPLVSCVWSTGASASLDYPARYLFSFLDNHGMLSVSGSPQWYTVCGGSATYVDRVGALVGEVVAGAPVTEVRRDRSGVWIKAAGRAERAFDRVVIATHADQALQMLADPSDDEKRVLGAFGYSFNETILHTDGSLMPRAVRAQASWNYLAPEVGAQESAPVVTYWMNRLQRLPGAVQYYVTLNGRDLIDPASIIATMDYAHPVYTPDAVAAQSHLPGLCTAQTAYAGAYHGWGFHEDGARSGTAAAEHFGAHWP